PTFRDAAHERYTSAYRCQGQMISDVTFMPHRITRSGEQLGFVRAIEFDCLEQMPPVVLVVDEKVVFDIGNATFRIRATESMNGRIVVWIFRPGGSNRCFLQTWQLKRNDFPAGWRREHISVYRRHELVGFGAGN